MGTGKGCDLYIFFPQMISVFKEEKSSDLQGLSFKKKKYLSMHVTLWKNEVILGILEWRVQVT